MSDITVEEIEKYRRLILIDSELQPSEDTSIINYDIKGPNDVVISGPLTSGSGPGRTHASSREAYIRLCNKYGKNRVKSMKQDKHRWCYLIKDLKVKGPVNAI
jgi:hypothetical protein